MNKKAWLVLVGNWKMHLKYMLYSDKTYNEKIYQSEFGRKIDWSSLQTFSDKLLFLKMHYSNLLENTCVDKFTVNNYVRQCGFQSIIKEIYQVCESPEQINLEILPEKFFIQCSHTQSFNYVVEKKDINRINEIKGIYKQLLKRRQYEGFRENNYKFIMPRIICSEYLEEPGRDSLTDYKIYCFGGKAKYFMVSYGELSHKVKNHKFDLHWNSIDHMFKEKPAINPNEIPHPENFEKMIDIAEKLSAPFPHVRVDLYNISGRIVFGEMTFYSNGGFVHVASEEMDKEIGSWIDLEKYADYYVQHT